MNAFFFQITKAFRSVYDFLTRRWLLSFLFMAAGPCWFTYLAVFGKKHQYLLTVVKTIQNGQMMEEKILSEASEVISIVFIVFSLLWLLAKSVADSIDKKKNSNSRKLYQNLLQDIGGIVGKKSDRFVGFIKDYPKEDSERQKIKVFHEITQPQDQIDKILEGIHSVTATETGIEKDRVCVSLLYSINPESEDPNDWEYFKEGVIDGLEKKEILQRKNTSFNKIREISCIRNNEIKSGLYAEADNGDFLFYADKKDAIKAGKYEPDNADKKFSRKIFFRDRTVGSIYCKDLSIYPIDENYCAILTVITYGFQICERYHEDNEKKFLIDIIPQFEKRLKVELSLYHMKNSVLSKCVSC